MSVFKKNDIMVSREGGMMNLGKTINDLRKKNNMTQEELAALLGVSPQAVQNGKMICPVPIYLCCLIWQKFSVSLLMTC